MTLLRTEQVNPFTLPKIIMGAIAKVNPLNLQGKRRQKWTRLVNFVAMAPITWKATFGIDALNMQGGLQIGGLSSGQNSRETVVINTVTAKRYQGLRDAYQHGRREGTPTEAVSKRDLQGYFAHKNPPPLGPP